MTLTAYASEQESLGYFRIFARPPGGFRREITLFRGAPVTPGSVSLADPFTEQTAQLALPQVTIFDTPGSGDLDWLVPDTDIDIVFQNTGNYEFNWRWEGFIVAYAVSLAGTDSTTSVDLKGCFYALDNFLAIPRYPHRPIPYEILMAMAFDQADHPCRLGKFQILFPEGWAHKVPEFKDPRYLSALKPWGVTTGQRWTGFTSRSTGSWEPMLSSHVQTMLTVMFAEGGRQWSIRNLGLRRPELFLRRAPDSEDGRIIEVQLGSPGVKMDASRDFSQRADVLYGMGQDEAGINYSGMEVSPDGKTTYFKPFAWSARAYPRKKNPMYDKSVTPKETMIRFQDGVDEVSALKIAQGQYQRFAEPGITGNISLNADLRYADGSLCPRMLIRAGATLRIKGLFGVVEGVLAHVTQVSIDFKGMTATLTFDTKYRDALTVEEVQARTRDALTPMRALQLGKYSNTIQDLILPWSYQAGSGMIPLESKNFFLKKVMDGDEFPYEKLTRQYPPSNPSYRPWYLRVGPMDDQNSSKNWCGDVAIPIRMGQAGTIRLTQIAAYDKHGNVMKVKFHVSIYTGIGVTPSNLPHFPHDPRGEPVDEEEKNPETPPLRYLKPRKKGVDGVRDKDRDFIPSHYKTFQAHPMYEAAWEAAQPNGFEWPWGSDANLATTGADLVVGWGNFHEPAGYSPGRFSKGADRTGILEDATQWGWNLEKFLKFDSNLNNRLDEMSGMLHILIYCDDQGDEPVFFMGRLVRVDPGTS